MIRTLGAVTVAVGVAGAFLVDQRVFVVAVMALAVLVTLDLADLVTPTMGRPVLPAAVAAAVGAPVVAAARPDQGWELLPASLAATLVLAFVLVVVFGRRDWIVEALAATLLCAVPVGLGATTLLLLGDLAAGERWVIVLAGAVAAGDVGVLVLERLPAAPAAGGWRPTEARLMRLVAAIAPAVIVGGAATIALAPTVTPGRAAVLGSVAFVLSHAAAELHLLVADEAGVDATRPEPVLGLGHLYGAADALLLTSPVVYLMAFAELV